MMVSVAPQVSARAGTAYISAVSMKLTPRASEWSQDGVGVRLSHLLAKGHGAQADGGDAQVALAQLDGVHGGDSLRQFRPQCTCALFLLQPQHAPLHLAGGRHRQGVDEFDLLGVLVGRQAAAHMGLQFSLIFSSNSASPRCCDVATKSGASTT
jgi:hypothetical protein